MFKMLVNADNQAIVVNEFYSGVQVYYNMAQ